MTFEGYSWDRILIKKEKVWKYVKRYEGSYTVVWRIR